MDAYVIGIAAAESQWRQEGGRKKERRKGKKEDAREVRHGEEGVLVEDVALEEPLQQVPRHWLRRRWGALLGWADGLGGRRRGDLKVGEGGRTRPMSGSCTPCSLAVLDVVDLAGLVGFVGLGVASAGAGAGAVAESWCVQLLQHGCRPVLASFVVCVSRRRRRSREKSSRARRRRIRE